jgi:hypothetical protein
MPTGPGPTSEEPPIGSTWRTETGRLLTVSEVTQLPGEIVFVPADDRITNIVVPREEWIDVNWTEVT